MCTEAVSVKRIRAKSYAYYSYAVHKNWADSLREMLSLIILGNDDTVERRAPHHWQVRSMAMTNVGIGHSDICRGLCFQTHKAVFHSTQTVEYN